MIASGDRSEGGRNAVMPTQPRQRTNVATTALSLLAGLLAAPVFAAPERVLLCDENDGQGLALSAIELSVTPVSSSEEMLQDHLLKPRTDAALRNAFADESADEGDIVEREEPEVDEPVAADPGVPSVSKQKRPVYKRQMYRRDI